VIKIYNTLSKKVETFEPLHNGKVNMYVCGPTVYGDIHVGNARPVIFFDFLKRYLSHLNYDVFYVSNITDIDDRIVEKAIEEKTSEDIIANKYTEAFINITKSIGSKLPDKMPKATHYISDMVRYIEKLLKDGYAYVKDSGVYFRVSKVKDYGKLSGQILENLEENIRIDNEDDKENSKDFALWKKVDEGVEFESPFGKGRPGWHTECAVMNHEIFNGEIDIHGGGADLIFPHHENEIAQTVAHSDHHLAKYWMHVARLNIENVKMSKSLGNTVLVKDLINETNPNIFRLLILGHQYRQPINYTRDLLDQYEKQYQKLESTAKRVLLQIKDNYKKELDITIIKNVEDVLNDDFNTPNLITILQDLTKELNKETDLEKLGVLYYTFTYILDMMGIDLNINLTHEILDTYEKWQVARSNKDFASADVLRKKLIDQGWL